VIGHLVAFCLGAASYYAGYKLYVKRRPEGSPWRPDVRRWWGQNEDLIEVEARRTEEISRRDFEAAQKSPLVKRVEDYSTPADQGQRDTPPHEEGDRPSVTLRQPGEGSEGRDAATSDRYRIALVLDEDVKPDWNDVRDADLVIRYFRDRARVVKDRYGTERWVDMVRAEALVARSDVVLHRGEA
jgi:hypothetical protein